MRMIFTSSNFILERREYFNFQEYRCLNFGTKILDLLLIIRLIKVSIPLYICNNKNGSINELWTFMQLLSTNIVPPYFMEYSKKKKKQAEKFFVRWVNILVSYIDSSYSFHSDIYRRGRFVTATFTMKTLLNWSDFFLL